MKKKVKENENVDLESIQSINGEHNGVPNAGHPPTGSMGFALWRMVLRSIPARHDQHIPFIFLDVSGLVAFYNPPGKIRKASETVFILQSVLFSFVDFLADSLILRQPF